MIYSIADIEIGILSPEFTAHIGNLALLATSENSKAGNRKYRLKRKDVYSKSSIKLTKKLNDIRIWGVNPIKRRAKMLATLANERWPRLTLLNYY